MWSDKGEDQGLEHVLQIFEINLKLRKKNINKHDTGACCPRLHVTSSSSSQDGNTEHGINPNFLAILVRFIYKSHDFFGNVNKKKCKVSMKCHCQKSNNEMLSPMSVIKKVDMVGPSKGSRKKNGYFTVRLTVSLLAPIQIRGPLPSPV